ncbi:MAG: hypothetical protein IJG13_10475 [Kiritimatiellae bacterium]|nr:hypothetical protein [Kiritimatiellia bacterium]MBQ3344566.1 hypothetical protein [Kiritimatiellia bacterium]
MSNETIPGLGELLRTPGELMGFAEGRANNWRLAAFLALVTVSGCALFGFAVGSFVDLRVAAFDAAKMVGVAAFSFVLCYPTLYVFANISGSRLSAARLAFLGLVFTATLGSLLAALSPILWLFSVSTENVAFIVVLSCLLAALSLAFVVRPVVAAAQKGIVARTAGLHLWLVVFAIVALQAVTLVRPMLAPIGTPRDPDGKCFFLVHFGKSVRPGAASAR